VRTEASFDVTTIAPSNPICADSAIKTIYWIWFAFFEFYMIRTPPGSSSSCRLLWFCSPRYRCA